MLVLAASQPDVAEPKKKYAFKNSDVFCDLSSL